MLFMCTVKNVPKSCCHGPTLYHALFVHYHAVSLLYHSTGVPAVGHPEVQGSEGGGGAPCQQAPAVWHGVVCVCPDLMKPHVLMHCCMDLLPFRFCPDRLHTQIHGPMTTQEPLSVHDLTQGTHPGACIALVCYFNSIHLFIT